VRILLPRVTDLEDVLRARAVLAGLAAELGLADLPQLGVMIETPAAAVLADQLAEAADFFSLGSNDLTQYTLAVDRTNSAVALRLDDFHPAVLRLIASAVEGAARHGRWVGLCGAMASDPLAAPLLIGLGVTEWSVSPGMVAELKQTVRQLSLAACREAALGALKLTSGAAVRNHLRGLWPWLEPQA
jgi:phosphocarrier protein FPr/phosphocarrier protein